MAGIGWNHFRHIRNARDAGIALVYGDNILLKKIDLKQDGVIDIPGKRGFQLRVSESGIRVLHSDCPQQVCVHTGAIRYDGQTIVCLPNRIVVSIEAKKTASVDAVCY
ncbi:MAG: NusG domain II-containing protein [Candidatus Omnitrophica bacterium]|nr:NusG domain II-containing protein [Candidatus Omnitrophota bacterium]MBU4477648.1 NusG domain II-containing protein [Candidatus Omnitrophota bacterium]MCG2703138.1 NusG domain II-containing protein [Candidatus Omnitrophota bacterium]